MEAMAWIKRYMFWCLAWALVGALVGALAGVGHIGPDMLEAVAGASFVSVHRLLVEMGGDDARTIGATDGAAGG